MTQTAHPTRHPRNPAAIVGLVAAVLAIPAFVFSLDIAAWILALVGIFASVIGLRRAGKNASGLVPAIIGVVIASLVLIVLTGLLVLFLTRPLRY